MWRHSVPVLVVAIAVALALFSNEGGRGRDATPLLMGIRAELDGQSAYSEPVQAGIRAYFDAPGPTRCERCAQVGLAYPLPALLLALPVAVLPVPLGEVAWFSLSVSLFAVALRLNGMPSIWLLSAPAFQAIRANNPSLLLVGLLLVGFWAMQHQRWWIVAACVALTIGVKPQTTLLLAGGLAVVALRAGQWRPLLVCCGTMGVLSLAVDPLWFQHWLAVVRDYRAITTNAAPYPWLWWLLPLPVWLLWRGQVWPGLALLQVLLFPLNIHSPYVTLPLLVGYIGAAPWGRRWAWLPGWFFVPLGDWWGYLLATITTLIGPFVVATSPAALSRQ